MRLFVHLYTYTAQHVSWPPPPPGLYRRDYNVLLQVIDDRALLRLRERAREGVCVVRGGRAEITVSGVRMQCEPRGKLARSISLHQAVRSRPAGFAVVEIYPAAARSAAVRSLLAWHELKCQQLCTSAPLSLGCAWRMIGMRPSFLRVGTGREHLFGSQRPLPLVEKRIMGTSTPTADVVLK